MRLLLPLRFVALLLSVSFAGQGWAADDATDSPATDVEAAKDRYEIPEKDVDALVAFIEKISNFRPKTADEFLEHRKQAPTVLRKAAQRIVTLEEDKQSKASRIAQGLLMSYRVQKLSQVPIEEKAETYRDLRDYLAGLDNLTRDELGLAFSASSALERSESKELAVEAYRTFGEMFQSQKDELLASYGMKMLGAARRANLVGNEIELSGQTLAGESFDLKDYRGKVVLVDFWATWCGPCIQELPNVKKNYEQYRDRGFEVVGISLDTDRNRLEKFVKDRELPWVTLFEEGAGWEHPVATHYGVMAIPTVMLVDQEGKVVSLSARGSELGQQLEKLLPEATESGDAE